jgi:hypothetical protein
LIVACRDVDAVRRQLGEIAASPNVRFLRGAVQRYVARDHGPINVLENGRPRLLD